MASTDLRLSEADYLWRLVTDPQGEIVLRAFFTSQAQEYGDKALAAIMTYDTATAQEYAFYANAYREGLTRLGEFAQSQLEKAKTR